MKHSLKPEDVGWKELCNSGAVKWKCGLDVCVSGSSCLLKKSDHQYHTAHVNVSLCVCVCFASSSGCLLDQQRVWFNWVCSTVICTAKPALNAVSLETHIAPGMDTLAALTCQLHAGDTHLTLVWAACLIESIISAVSCTLKPESIGMWDIWNKSDLKHSSLSAEETFVRLTMTATRWTSVSDREVRDTGDQTFTIAEHPALEQHCQFCFYLYVFIISFIVH